MAKKKKHFKKKHKHKKNVANNTTVASTNIQKQDNNTAAEAKKVGRSSDEKATLKKPVANELKTVKKSVEIQDVKYSLLLMAIIIVVFGLIYLLSMNETVSKSIYGLIKINY